MLDKKYRTRRSASSTVSKLSECRFSCLLLAGPLAIAFAVASDSAHAQQIIDGERVTVPGSQSSPWNISGELRVGSTTTGTLEITSGGVVSNRVGSVGYSAGSSGTVTVDGTGARWNNVNNLFIGGEGTGELTISNGATVSLTSSSSISNSLAAIGRYAGSSGAVTVTGTGSQWIVDYGSLYVGHQGEGSLTITDGGVVTSNNGTIGSAAGSTGTVLISGQGSQWNVVSGGYYLSAMLSVGTFGNARLTIADGGVATSSAGVVGNYGTGIALVTGAGSQWLAGQLTVGANGGDGTLTINDGAKVTSEYTKIGSVAGSSGTAYLTDAGSQWLISDRLYVAEYGNANLTITNGGFMSVGEAVIVSDRSGSSGTLTVTGTGSQLIQTAANSGLTIGSSNGSNGNLIISDGASVSGVAGGTGSGTIGSAAGSSGTVLVTGAGSQWDMSLRLYVASRGEGRLVIADGGHVSNSEGTIGNYAQGSGRVTVTGAGSLWENIDGRIAGRLIIGNEGTGILEIADNGSVATPNTIIASSAGSTGTLAIGAYSDKPAVAPGTITTESITFGAGNGSILFNHTATDYVFDATVNGGANNASGSNTGIVGTGLIKAISGRTILSSDHEDFLGSIQISSAGILQVNSNLSGATASTLPGGTLEGNGVVGSLNNAGIVSPGASIGILSVAGNYVGNNGNLLIEAVLSDDSSPADKLVIAGDVSGSTMVHVTNLGGTGAQTVNGIPVIDVGGVSPASSFTLAGDYVTPDGQQAVIAGAYAYTLHHNSPTGTVNGNWYLTSLLVPEEPPQPPVDPGETGPRYHPGVGVYEQYPQALASLNSIPTLQQRIGNRYWQSGQSGAFFDGNGVWGRIEGVRQSVEAAHSTGGSTRDIDYWKVQAGFDVPVYQRTNGSLLTAGANVIYGSANADVDNLFGRGKIDITGYGLGANLTWYGANGLYVDGQAHYMWFDSDLSSLTTGRKLNTGNDGQGYAFSVETGWRYQLSELFSLTPQLQLVYSNVDFDSFYDVYHSQVSLGDGDSLRLRSGLALNYETPWTDGNRAHLYGIFNLYNEFLDGSQVNVSGVNFRTRDERLWTEIGIGGSYNWNKDIYSLYANVNIGTSIENFGDDYSFSGTLGFRMKW